MPGLQLAQPGSQQDLRLDSDYTLLCVGEPILQTLWEYHRQVSAILARKLDHRILLAAGQRDCAYVHERRNYHSEQIFVHSVGYNDGHKLCHIPDCYVPTQSSTRLYG